ncbi:MFS transporter [Escherichia coli]|nr:MFS transporter [Escherichia coli]
MTKPNHELSPALIVLMSIATGLAVASNYYAQPLLDTIARNFSLSASSAGFIVTAAQLGYAAGLLFLVPLGDMFERRRLIVSMTLLAAGGMLITASSQSLAMMILGTALTGLFSVVAQILVPLAATLASPDKRGWIERRESDNDRRCLHLQLTEKGHEFLREVLPPQHNCLHQLWSALSTTEKDQLEQITRKLLSRLDQMEQDGVVLEAMS